MPLALVLVMLAPLANLMAAAGWSVNNIDITDGQDEARTVFCKGETVKLTVTDACRATAKRSYSWSPGGSTNNPLILTNLNAGNYTSTVTVTIGAESGQASAGFTVVQVEMNQLSAGPQGGYSATRFENGVASGPIAISGYVTVIPNDQVNNIALRLAHNVKTLRQFAHELSATNMFQISTDGAWMNDGDSTMNADNTLPGILLINGADEPSHSYWTASRKRLLR